MKKILLIRITLLFSILFLSCKEEKNEDSLNRTIIVYMAGDNNLSGDALNDIREMEQNYSEEGVNFLVFVDLNNELPYLLKIGKGNSTVIQTYSELNSADPIELNKILKDCIQLYPAKEYGLILWSHGTSWLPSKSKLKNKLKSFSHDSGVQMNIKDLAEAIPLKFDYIIFDACLMGAVEVAYELKDKADFIISPSSETISDGFPYDRIVPELLKPQVDLRVVAQEYFEYYNSQPEEFRSATIALIKTAELPALASEMKLLILGNAISSAFERTKVQRLDAYQEQYIFDLGDYVNKAYPDAYKKRFFDQLSRVVLYKANTQRLLRIYPIDNYCGLSCYIFHPQRTDLNEEYVNLSWSSDSGIDILYLN